MTTIDDAWRAWLDAAGRELRRSRERQPSLFPHYSEDGSWLLLDVGTTSSWDGDTYEHGNWTAGFWFGVMWLLAAAGGDASAAEAATGRLRLLLPRAHDTTTHDLGFLFYPSVTLGSSLGLVPPAAERAGLDAAATLARRFNPRGDYLQAFGAIGDHRSAGTSTTDTMMNLPLLWWAAARTGEPVLFDVARRHARTSARLFLRGDGSSYHLNRFDPISGAILHRGTFQGASDQSCWSRGQAWLICGFAWAYAVTGEPELGAAAETAARWFWDALPPDGVPPWDFADTDPAAPRDASAAAIAALGALLLDQVDERAQHPERARDGGGGNGRERYRDLAERTLGQLAETCLNRDPGCDGILLRSCYSRPHGLGLDGATGWGDFYLGLALAIATGALSLEAVLGRPPAGTAGRWPRPTVVPHGGARVNHD